MTEILTSPFYRVPGKSRERLEGFPESATEYSDFAAKAVACSFQFDFHQGDMVEHTAFGKGMVLSVMKMGGDALLEVAFDEIGTKELMAKTAASDI